MSLLGSEVVRGTLDLLILRSLANEPDHGWGVSQKIQSRSRQVLVVNQGSLYPALQRLKRDGFVRAQWRITENNRRALYYTLTRGGLKRLHQEEAQWREAVKAVNRVLRLATTG